MPLLWLLGYPEPLLQLVVLSHPNVATLLIQLLMLWLPLITKRGVELLLHNSNFATVTTRNINI